MKRLLGPELYWVIAYAVSYLIAARNVPPSPAGNEMLERMWWLFPLVAVPLSYLALLAPASGRWWMLLRINLAALVGLMFCLHRITTAIDWGDSRNSGVFAGFALGLGLGMFLLLVGDVVTVVRWWFLRSRG